MRCGLWGLTNDIPWEKNALWLDLLSHSGTPLFVSPDPKALGDAQKQALMRAFELAAKPIAPAEPLDWKDNRTPEKWKTASGTKTFDWS